MFITFEGGEGAGKSTQIKLLSEYFKKQGKESIITREPGGVDTAEEIRKILVFGDKDKLAPLTEILLNFAARIEHTEKLIKPSLKQKKIVISDRYFDSTLAYQGYGYGYSIDEINMFRQICLGSFKPDLTFILDIDPRVGLDRANSRDETKQRYEKLSQDFHQKVQAGFLEIAQQDSQRCFVLDATQHIEQVHQQIIEKVENC